MTIGLNEISLGLGAIGFACFAWPIYQRLTGKAEAEPLGSGKSLRSPLWWAGFVLTVAAIFLQRIAAQQAAGG
ncbi:conserved hypothetical protein [Bosea sp. 62]|uniref:hypothetical protein n=1 Tax=unclassified Bosea (in: a-proteobacteria) TaxID=2653178 RepID=UPI00125170B8|nr:MULTISPECIES: hypothetical protein [unclassified Bosea (in: a-proteobacteria)]CAD5246576.1 conserved hypothetical protein [Bosea sp. 21B]CAD5247295.1 conserved hypothetical protein [Bosea sp. 7B]CAD5269133.1 conserved hypothetical protein [Bosea sp. 46]VVT50633.1 conserved hypothetical protein [Bosea sp. EC-HK365B]VXA98536.1 conserved hypothetical protein [Bosea sp. 127]